jgi:putative ABC transport system permease protein
MRAMASRNTSSNRFLRPLYIFLGLIVLALKRLLYRPGLTLLALASIALAVGLVSSAGFFAQAVDRSVLNQELIRFAAQTGRPPFSMRVYFLPSANIPLTLEAAERLAPHVTGTLEQQIGLPPKSVGIEVESGAMMLHPAHEPEGTRSRQMGSVNLVHFENVVDYITVEGEPFAGERSGEVLDVWMPDHFAAKAGANVGDLYAISHFPDPTRIQIRVRGIWTPKDPEDPFWFTDPELSLSDGLLVRRLDFIERVQPRIPSGTRFASWHVRLDEARVQPGNARRYLTGLTTSKTALDRLLPGIRIDVSPIKPLEQFVNRSSTLTILLLGFNIPALGFLLYFLFLTSAIIARWQRRETAILVSRGMNVPSVLSITFVEQLLLFVAGVPLGIAAGLLIARFMGNTSSFLTFVPRESLPVSLEGLNLSLLLATMGVVLLTRLAAASSAARQSNVEEEREQARPMKTPFWYRYYLDLLLVLPAAYGYRLLSQQGSLAMLVKDRPSDLYQDPLLILLPALFTLVAALLAMRLFPLLLRLMDRLAGVVPWVTPHLALQQLGRQSQAYINPLLLIIVCLALGVYTYSLAGSLDKWLVDRLYYQVGADVTFRPMLVTEGSGSTTQVPVSLPIEEYLKLPGVQTGTAVGDFPARVSLANGPQVRGRFLGVDRLTFGKVAWFRRDFATEPLGGLMNLLAQQQDAVVIPQSVLEAGRLEVGDQLRISMSVESNVSMEAIFTIVGTYTYFPTVYEENPTAIGNLEYLTWTYGMPVPETIWLRMQPGADGAEVLRIVREGMRIEPVLGRDTMGLITAERAKTERVGVFGTLSIGFIASAVMAFSGLLINTYASLNERLYRFTVLYAIGLQRRQILGQVLMEYLFLTAYGAAAGAIIGSQVSRFFAPFFRITGAQQVVLPPLIPVIARDQITDMAMAATLILPATGGASGSLPSSTMSRKSSVMTGSAPPWPPIAGRIS